ncbi:hypothetical protein [Deinococcus sp. QL22]|uniref:hypothetical protein n=1 Tax=Deinococcus sp. QL22 TaxID=2939437 RepID=UPI002016F624|nr:hypothetical protein [Deinococcus sp. QL22]UQN06529.1 hypothetical protein M1R55_01005 [Deinococcus sp. QL22]
MLSLDAVLFEACEGQHTVLLNLGAPLPEDFPYELETSSTPGEVLLRALLSSDDTLNELIILRARAYGARSVTVVYDARCTLPTGPLDEGGLHLGTAAQDWLDGPDGFAFDAQIYEQPGVVSVWVDTQFWEQGAYNHDDARLEEFGQLTPLEEAFAALDVPEWDEALQEALQAARELGVTEVECLFVLGDHGFQGAPGEVEGRPSALFLGTFPVGQV